MKKPVEPEAPDAPTPPEIKVRACGMCGLELQPGTTHLSKDHCVRDARERIAFLRQITLGQAKELDWERTAIAATHRIAYILLTHLTKKGKNNGRVKLPRSVFEAVHPGAGVTLTELEETGEFEVVAVLPAPPKEEKPS